MTGLGFRYLPEVQGWRDGIEATNKTNITLTCDDFLTQYENRHGLLNPDMRSQALVSCEELSWRKVEIDYDNPLTQPHRLLSVGYVSSLLAVVGFTLWKAGRLTQPILRFFKLP